VDYVHDGAGRKILKTGISFVFHRRIFHTDLESAVVWARVHFRGGEAPSAVAPHIVDDDRRGGRVRDVHVHVVAGLARRRPDVQHQVHEQRIGFHQVASKLDSFELEKYQPILSAEKCSKKL